MAFYKEGEMISNLIIFGVGMIIGAMGMMVLIVLMSYYATRQKRPPTKDEWRMM